MKMRCEFNSIENNDTLEFPYLPKDPFSLEQRRYGFIILHIIGVFYIFFAIAVVCYDFFIPTLEATIKKFRINYYVVGTIFMAIDMGITQLLTSVIDVIVLFDVSIGAVLSSGIFRILFSIGLCAIFSRTFLSLAWGSLFRECTFYSVSLVVLMYFIHDNLIHWWEAFILILIYGVYLIFVTLDIIIETIPTTLTNARYTFVNDNNQINVQPPTPMDAHPLTTNKSLKNIIANRSKALQIVIAVILTPMESTLPNIRKLHQSGLIIWWAFLGSIMWLSVLAYLLIWFVFVISDTFNISAEVMRLTIIATATSIPNIMSSVIVARKGYDDMAVASSVGSSIFGITFCLPAPLMIYSIYYKIPVKVNSCGLPCLVAVTFIILMCIILLLVVFRWRVNKRLGVIMFFLYFLFIVISVILDYGYVVCPI
ncbi:sodium/potassium/calcium exchanger Nckx30C-like [Contarinia nasturtii]|uniref:sodium/potassium/calcium exchanger Nckx30C-like n=1 Tax=Contarinia nasturtii TaxID=265458 RepID=UPI0012D46B8E|nr:sodium/potassium/calcium exchanger Nckx30C-like [Contarinia nasturtii]